MFEDEDLPEISFAFELLNSDDGKLVTLVCSSDRALSPEEYAYALRKYAESIEIHYDISEQTLIN